MNLFALSILNKSRLVRPSHEAQWGSESCAKRKRTWLRSRRPGRLGATLVEGVARVPDLYQAWFSNEVSLGDFRRALHWVDVPLNSAECSWTCLRLALHSLQFYCRSGTHWNNEKKNWASRIHYQSIYMSMLSWLRTTVLRYTWARVQCVNLCVLFLKQWPLYGPAVARFGRCILEYNTHAQSSIRLTWFVVDKR